MVPGWHTRVSGPIVLIGAEGRLATLLLAAINGRTTLLTASAGELLLSLCIINSDCHACG